MRKLLGVLVFAIGVSLAGFANADQVKVNIVYPINGSSIPIINPALGPLSSAYITASFSVTCGGGSHSAQWGFDGQGPLGTSNFYDQTSVQLVQKLPGGSHVFWVKADCGGNKVQFTIGH
jgi:hypothetical protein